MASIKPSADTSSGANRPSNEAASAPNLSTMAKPSPTPPSWSSQAPTFSIAQNGSGSTGFSSYSASTAEILERLKANPGNAAGTAAFEAKKAEVMQSYLTSDKLPTPPPVANSGRRGGRGGSRGTPSMLKTEVGANVTPGSGATPTSARGSGRGRGRAGRGGRGGKRKRADSLDSDDDSDISTSYTPLPTRTKSGRNVNKPVAFVPTLPESTPTVKRRKSVKQILAAQCKTCHRSVDPGNNRIVFCDGCNAAYHQYCHDPPIDNDVVNVLEKEWLCGPCERAKQTVVEGTEGLISGESLTIDEKRAYLSTVPQARLVTLLLHATVRYPELPVFPPNIQDLIPENTSSNPTATYAKAPATASSASDIQPLPSTYITSPTNGIPSTSNTPRSSHHQGGGTDSSDMDPAEAQLLGEISRSQNPTPATVNAELAQHPLSKPPSGPPPLPPSTTDNPPLDEYDDGYDTDPPAHYPKAGNGLARTLRPESEDLQWLVDDNFEVFSHGWKGDGSGLGADGGLSGLN